MKVIGIDPGTARMGYAIIDVGACPDEIKLVEADVLITSPELEQHKRLKFLFHSLNKLIKSHAPDVMVIERLFFNTNVKTAINVGQARGIGLLAAATGSLDVYEYTALEAKLALTGYGRADKKQMQDAVKKILSLVNIVKSDDANDAVAMGLCFIKKTLYQEMKQAPCEPRQDVKKKSVRTAKPAKVVKSSKRVAVKPAKKAVRKKV